MFLNKFLGKSGSLRHHLIGAASGSFIIRMSTTALSLVTAVVLARVLGAEGFGVFVFCMAVSQILAVPAMLGMQQLVVRELASYRTQGAFALMRGLLRRARQSVLLASVALMLLIGTVAYFTAGYLDALHLYAFWIALLLVPLTALMQVHNSALRGLRWIIQGQLGQVLRPGIFLLLIGALFFYVPERLDPQHAVAMQVIGAAAALFFLLLLLRRAMPEQAKHAEPQFQTRTWIKSAWPMLLAAGMQILNKETSVLMLGALVSTEEIGFFRVAQRGAMFIPFGLHAVNQAIAPTISDLYTKGQLQHLQQVVTKSARVILAYALPVALILMLGGFWLIQFIFGQEFTPATWPLVILCAGQLVNAAMGSVGYVLTMSHNERLSAKGAAIGAIANVILNAFLVPMWGAVGAAFATTISLVIWNVLLAIWLFQKLGITTTAVGRIKSA